jgi:hypothetical protein
MGGPAAVASQGPVLRSRRLADGARRVSNPETTVRRARAARRVGVGHREKGLRFCKGWGTATARAGASSSKSNHQKGVAVTGDLRLFGLPPILSATDFIWSTDSHGKVRETHSISDESELPVCFSFFFCVCCGRTATAFKCLVKLANSEVDSTCVLFWDRDFISHI